MTDKEAIMDAIRVTANCCGNAQKSDILSSSCRFCKYKDVDSGFECFYHKIADDLMSVIPMLDISKSAVLPAEKKD
jgi:hypothetical protein